MIADAEIPWHVDFNSFPFDKNRGLLIYDLAKDSGQRRINTERIMYLYDREYPSGAEFLKIRYPKGKIIKYYWESEKRFYFLTYWHDNDDVKERLWRIDFN